MNLTGILAGFGQGQQFTADLAQRQAESQRTQILTRMAQEQLQDYIRQQAAQGTAFKALQELAGSAAPPSGGMPAGGLPGDQTALPDVPSYGGSMTPLTAPSPNPRASFSTGPTGLATGLASPQSPVGWPFSSLPKTDTPAPPSSYEAARGGPGAPPGPGAPLTPPPKPPMGASPLAGAGGQPNPIAQAVQQNIPQGMTGVVGLPQLANAIQRVAPNASDQEKFAALAQLQHLLTPDAKAQMQVLMAELRGQIQGELRSMTTPHQQAQFDERVRHDRAIEAQGAERSADARNVHEDAAAARADTRQDRLDAKAEKDAEKQQKAQDAIRERDAIVKEATDLAAAVRANPNLVGLRGAGARFLGGVKEQVFGSADDRTREADEFAARVSALQARLTKPLLGARYFSGPAQARMAELVPSLGRLDNPTRVTSALDNLSKIMGEISIPGAPGGTEQIGGGSPAVPPTTLTATGPGGHKIHSTDGGNTWLDENNQPVR
jgi:hypothetical protein